jgi:beta-lactamase superfamily II metal-dependent hydrolase
MFLLLVLALEAGKPLPAWSPGGLDIHHINTGKGNATFFVLPDATTLLIDAGATGESPRNTPPRPDGSRPPGEWIARYITAMFPRGRKPVLDYGYLTHFHGDHMSAFPDVGARIPIKKMIDRGEAVLPPPEAPDFKAYRAFTAKLKVETFKPGRRDQIVLVHEPKKYPTFVVQNVSANGEIWTGRGVETTARFPPRETWSSGGKPSENMCSLVVRVSYGKFDYYSGGDIPGEFPSGAPEWQDIETPVARAVGPVEVALLDHHGFWDSTNAFWVSTLRPRVFISHFWSPSHLSPTVMQRLFSSRLYQGPRDVFATNMMDSTKSVGGAALDKVHAPGHVVVRVAPGGDRYHVVQLEDASEGRLVKAVHGPFEAN